MGIFGALLLVVTIFLRPQEFVPGLASVGLLNVVTGIAVLGIVVEFAMGKTKSAWSPQLPFLLAFVVWCFVSTLVKTGREGLSHTATTVLFSSVFMLVIMYSARTLKRFAAITGLLVVISVSLAAIGIQQSRADFKCILISGEDLAHNNRTSGTVTEESCVLSPRECEDDAKKHGHRLRGGDEYLCEKPGPFETFSIGHGRVRWRGVLADPNELALAIGAAFAFVFAFYSYLQIRLKWLLFAACAVAAGYAVVQTQSRGGSLVLLGVFGVYFVRKYGTKGALAGGIMGMPVLLLGGRSGEEADSSTLERLGALYEGVDMVRAAPFLGVGQGQFAEHYFITAHNSYLLAAAELGLPGMLLWGLLVYVSMKIPFVIAWGRPASLAALDPRAVPFAMSLFVAFAGILIGVLFLSFCYHAMLFVYFGLAGALYGVVKQECPEFEIGVSKKEVAAVAGICGVILAFLFVYTRIKGAP